MPTSETLIGLDWFCHAFNFPSLFSSYSGRENNFEITNPAFVTTQSVPYDLRSIMHYGARAFSSNGQLTIDPVDPNVSPNDLGQRRELSDRDLQHIQALYCGGKFRIMNDLSPKDTKQTKCRYVKGLGRLISMSIFYNLTLS